MSSVFNPLACAQCSSRTEAPSNGLRKYHRRERHDGTTHSHVDFLNLIIDINTFVDIRRHTHTTLQEVSPKIKTKRVCYNLPAVCAFIVHFLSAFLSSISLFGKVAMATKTVYCFRHYSSRSSFCARSARFNYSLL